MKLWLGRHRRLRASLCRFRADERGNVAVVLGLTLIILMLSIGAAIDVGRWLHARRQTVAAVDAAVLAGGRALQVNSKDTDGAIAAAEKYYKQNVATRFPVESDTVSFGVSEDKMGITASGTAYIDTPFLHFASVDRLPLLATSQTKFSGSKISVGGSGGQNIEISLILDITGSMMGSKINDLKAAAKDLVNIVVWQDQSEYYSKVALVPYSLGVNVGNLANTVRGSVGSGTDTKPGKQNYKFTNSQNRQKTFPISTCATERTGSQAYTDASPATAKVGLNYDASNGNASQRFPCPSAQLIPLTSDKDKLTNAIGSYQANGPTAGHIGLAWGWYTLSPNWSSVFTGDSTPASYAKLTELGRKGQPLLKKIAVLMTDGEFNTAYCNGVISKDSGIYNIPAADRINCNATNGSSDSQALKLCDKMKKAGIEVYTVGFQAGYAANQMLNQCATEPGKAYVAENGEQLRDAFRDIALKLSSLYLSR